MTTICDGLVVLELGSGSVAGALCGMLLVDNGARVLKVEPPEGDRLRHDTTSGFLVWCRGKESVVIDLRTVPAATSSSVRRSRPSPAGRCMYASR